MSFTPELLSWGPIAVEPGLDFLWAQYLRAGPAFLPSFPSGTLLH